jgi:hypothetical protein
LKTETNQSRPTDFSRPSHALRNGAGNDTFLGEHEMQFLRGEPHEVGVWEHALYDVLLNNDGCMTLQEIIDGRLQEVACSEQYDRYTDMIDALLLVGRIADQVEANKRENLWLANEQEREREFIEACDRPETS